MDNPLKRKLMSGNPVLGVWSIIPSPIVAEIVGLSGFDFQILDMEHGVFDLHSLDQSVRACESTGCSPIVRVPAVIAHIVQSVMDLGAHGIVFPQITGKDSAVRAIASMRFAPHGTRGYNPFTRAALYANPATNEAGKLRDGFGLSAVIVENEEAHRNLDELLAVPELDLVYLGVYDMAVALGCKGDTTDPKVRRFVESSVRTIRSSGKACGLMVKSGEEIDAALKLGANFLVYAVDTHLLYRTASEAVKQFGRLASISGKG